MIRLWDSGSLAAAAEEGGEEETPSSQGSIPVQGEESPLPQPTPSSDVGTTISEGPLLAALLNKMETFLDQVCVCVCVCVLR